MGFFSKKAEEKQTEIKNLFDPAYKIGLYPKGTCPDCGSEHFLLMNYKNTATVGDLQRDVIDERFLGSNTGVCKHCGIILLGKVYLSGKNEDICFSHLTSAITDLYIIHKKIMTIYADNAGNDSVAQQMAQKEFQSFMDNRAKEKSIYYNDMNLPNFINNCFAFRYNIK